MNKTIEGEYLSKRAVTIFAAALILMLPDFVPGNCA